MVAAHPTYAFGTVVRVTNLATNRQVVVRVVDRGFSEPERDVLSRQRVRTPCNRVEFSSAVEMLDRNCRTKAARAGWLTCRLLFATGFILLLTPSARGQLRPDPAVLASAPSELVAQLRAQPFTYFRFINRAWITRACEAFADVPDVPIVRLHGDAHVEQFAVTRQVWGLDDFDDSARGPLFVDLVRYLGSVDLATRARGWTADRDDIWDRFLQGYRRGLTNPRYQAPEPRIVRRLRAQAPAGRAEFLAWGEARMQPMDDAASKAVMTAMEEFERFIRRDRSNLPPGYFAVVRSGWLRVGVGSTALRKVLFRIQGPTAAADDDVLLELKEAANLEGLGCLQATPSPARIIDGTRQIGRLKHDILAVGPSMLLPPPLSSAIADRNAQLVDWWVSSWEPTYRELDLNDLASKEDLAEIAFDSGVQLGAGEPQGSVVRKQALLSINVIEGRVRRETEAMIAEMLEEWQKLGQQ